MGEAISEAARREPDRFFAVLAQEPALLERQDVVWTLGYVKDARVAPALLVALRYKLAALRAAAPKGSNQRAYLQKLLAEAIGRIEEKLAARRAGCIPDGPPLSLG